MAFKGAVGRFRRINTRRLVLGGTAVSATAAQLNRANVRVVSVPVGVVTVGDMPSTVSLVGAPVAMTVNKVGFVPDAAFSKNADSFNFTVINAGTAGDGTATIASYAGTATDLVAYKMLDLGTPANTSVATGGSIVFQVTKQGSSGATSKAGVVVLEVKE